ncbi:hypothetical protein E2320_017970 [Naja naja]|nr:hypothetical protein E2320_017970 [Naja naja]
MPAASKRARRGLEFSLVSSGTSSRSLASLGRSIAAPRHSCAAPKAAPFLPLGSGRKQSASLEGRPGPLLLLRRKLLHGLLCAAALSGLRKDDLLEPLADSTIHPHDQAQAQEEGDTAHHKAHRFEDEPAGGKRSSTG